MHKKKIFLSDIKFPGGFLWGTATAAHQVEGNNIHSDWWHWEKSKKLIPDSGHACNHYHLFREDFKLAKEILHNNSHRLSIEWARIEPQEGIFSEKQTVHYRNVLESLREMGLKPMVTLHHFTNPEWFSKKGGWQNKENVKFFKRYVSYCVREFGDLIDYWIIINEPNVYAPMSFIKGLWPPEKKNIFTAIKVYLNLARAHKSAYKIIHKRIPGAYVSSAINMGCFKAIDLIGKILILPYRLVSNYSFLILIRGHYDFIGINYYVFHVPTAQDIPILKLIRRNDLLDIIYGERTDVGWPIYPQGIYEVTTDIWARFKKPIIITENGIADRKDTKRPRFVLDHLVWIAEAMKEGADIRGYFYWTLMDNIEWILGERAKFGLFKTDYKTFERIPRSSAFVYGEICKNNAVPLHLSRRFFSKKRRH